VASLESEYGERNPPNHHGCHDGMDRRGCATNSLNPCTVGTDDRTATRVKYVLESDLTSGTDEMHFLSYFLQYGGKGNPREGFQSGAQPYWPAGAVDPKTPEVCESKASNLDEAPCAKDSPFMALPSSGWALGKYGTEALRSVMGTDLFGNCGNPAKSGDFTPNSKCPSRAYPFWAWLVQADDSGAAMKYPTTRPWKPVVEWIEGDSFLSVKTETFSGKSTWVGGPRSWRLGDDAYMMGGAGSTSVNIDFDPPAQDPSVLDPPEWAPTDIYSARRRMATEGANDTSSATSEDQADMNVPGN